MKKVISKVLSVALAFMVAFGLVIVPSVSPVHADGACFVTAKYAKNVKYYYGAKYCQYVILDMGSRLNGAKNVKVTSSKKSVVKTFKYYKDSKGMILLKVKKGTARVTIKCKKNGKNKTYKSKIKVVKYKNPFKGIYVGDKNCASKFNKRMLATYKNTLSTEQKISIKMKSGQKIKNIHYDAINMENSKIISKTIKNNSSIKLKGNSEVWDESITVTVYDKKKKTTSYFYLYI